MLFSIKSKHNEKLRSSEKAHKKIADPKKGQVGVLQCEAKKSETFPTTKEFASKKVQSSLNI